MKSKHILFAAGLALGYFVCRRRWALLHNCVAHPAVGLFGEGGRASRFHDWTRERWGGEG